VVNEAKKFDVAGAFRREEVSTDIGPVNKRNAKIDPDKVKSDNSDDYQAMKPEDVAALVKGFDFAGKSGIGILIVMDGMNKTKKEISGYVTLVDMKAKKVLFTERVEGGLGMGFGYTNVYLTGINVLRTGRVEAHLPTLLEQHPIPEPEGIEDLVARKRAGAEKTALSPGEVERHLPLLDRLERKLTEAAEDSELPQEPSDATFAALDDIVIAACRELG
jgi:hypothetical protein